MRIVSYLSISFNLQTSYLGSGLLACVLWPDCNLLTHKLPETHTKFQQLESGLLANFIDNSAPLGEVIWPYNHFWVIPDFNT